MKRIQNKKIYYLAMLSIVGGLSLNTYNNYKPMTKSEKMTYLTNIDPTMKEKVDTITYNALSDLHVIFLSKTNENYITIKQGENHYDYFSGTKINDYDFFKNSAIAIDYDIKIFLLKYDFYKDEYSNNDLINLLNMIKEDYKLEKDNTNSYALVLKKEEK